MPTDLTTTSIGGADLAAQMEFAKAVTAGGRGNSILPEAYRDNPANVLIAVGLGQAMGLSPAEAMYRISVIKGKPSAGAELIAANVRKAGHKLRVHGDETTCTATILRADDPDFEFTVTRDLAWAKQMGLASNDNYRKQPGTMLQWRAITAVARLACPEALYGVTYTPDELSEAPAGPARPTAGEVLAATTSYDDTTSVHITEDSTDASDEAAEPGITAAQQKKMGALMREAGITQRDDAIAYVSQFLGRIIASRSELTRTEAHAVIEALQGDAQATSTQAAEVVDAQEVQG